VIAPAAGRLPSSVLELSSLLQTTLEIEVQIELFGNELQRAVAIDGLRFLPPNSDRQINFGNEATHSANYQLTLEDQALGAMTVFRTHAFTPSDIAALENLLCGLVYPLRNGLTYLRAVEMASRDPLTGVSNRRALDQALSREVDLANRQGAPLSLLMIDIDHFKHFNDNFGHAFGDDVLIAIAQTIANTIRRSDLLFRFGGEEFVVLASHTNEDGAMLLAERIRENVAALRSVRGRETAVSVSVGVARLKQHDDETRLFERADEALYSAKQHGRNRSELAD
jgi:diguanylate cyclase (GGDEF)-like protein